MNTHAVYQITSTANPPKQCTTDAGVTGNACSSLSPVLTHLQGSQCIYTRDSSLRAQILQLLRIMVDSAPEAVLLQSKNLLAMLLRMRGSLMLEVTLADGELDLVGLMRTLNAETPDKTLTSRMHCCYCTYCGCAMYHGVQCGAYTCLRQLGDRSVFHKCCMHCEAELYAEPCRTCLQQIG